MTEQLKKYIKDVLDRTGRCGFDLPWSDGDTYCFLLPEVCVYQGEEVEKHFIPERSMYRYCRKLKIN